MKPTAEMVERAEVLVERLRDADMDGYDLSMERATDALAQALADEHERAMERAAGIAEAWAWDGREPLAAHLRDEVAAAIRAAAKGDQ